MVSNIEVHSLCDYLIYIHGRKLINDTSPFVKILTLRPKEATTLILFSGFAQKIN